MRRYMVVANQTLGGDELIRVIRERAATEPSEFWVVVPATEVHELAGRSVPMTPMPVMGGVLEVPGPPEEGRRLAEEQLQAALRKLADAGVKGDGEVGDPDPLRAVEDALSRRPFDEIIVSTLPQRLSRWLRQDLPTRLEHKFHLPVTHVEAAQAASR
jgi:nucleotide-binding universal stress UspA family protein